MYDFKKIVHERILSDKTVGLLVDITRQADIKTYLSGEFILNKILDIPDKRLSVVVDGDAKSLAKTFGERVRCRAKVFNTATLRYHGYEITFISLRKNVKNGFKVITLKDYLSSVSFTIESLAISLNEPEAGIIDFNNGVHDLDERIIKAPFDPNSFYGEKPIRMLQAVKLYSRLYFSQKEFQISEEDLSAIKRNAKSVSNIAKEKIHEAINGFLQCSKPSVPFDMMTQTGLLAYILPEVTTLRGVKFIKGRGYKDNYIRTLEVLDNVASMEEDGIRKGTLKEYIPKSDGQYEIRTRTAPYLWLRWAALLLNIGKDKVKKFSQKDGWTFNGHEVIASKMVPTIFKNLRLPLDDRMSYVQKLVSLQKRPKELASEECSDSAFRSLLHDAGNAIDDLMLLCSANVTSKNTERREAVQRDIERVWKRLLEIESKDEIKNFDCPINGNYIMETYHIEPCNTISLIKGRIIDAILNKEISGDFASADAYMKKIAPEYGLHLPVDPQNSHKEESANVTDYVEALDRTGDKEEEKSPEKKTVFRRFLDLIRRFFSRFRK